MDAHQKKSHAQYTKAYPEWQGEFFKEVAGKADTDDVFSKIADDLCAKFPCFFIEQMSHKDSFHRGSVSESSLGALLRQKGRMDWKFDVGGN